MNQLPPFQTITPQRNVSDSIFIPFIRTKRMHRKSRFGCITCKKRRVKCDETQPKCLKCRQRGVECVYADRPDKAVQGTDDTGLTTPKNEGASPPAQKSPASSTTTSEASPISPELDAEIARYFLEHTIKTFSNSSVRRSMHWIWHAFVPSLAYSYPTVRHGMLAVAAISLHFAHQDAAIQLDPLSEPLTSSQYMDASVAHGDIFVNESRQQLDALEPNNVDANTVATRLLSVLSFAFFRHNRQVGLDLADPRAWTWLHLTRGVYTVHSSLMAVDQVVHPIITEDMIPEQDPFPRQFTHALPIASGGQQQMLAFLNDTRVERFSQLREALDNGTFFFGSGVTATQNRTAAAGAIEFLAQITEHICTWTEMSSLFRAQCSWPVQLSDDFISMLTRCDRSALAIYTHWLMLMAVGEDMWWVGDMGKAGIQMVLDLVPESDTGLQTILARPRQLLNLTGWSLR